MCQLCHGKRVIHTPLSKEGRLGYSFTPCPNCKRSEEELQAELDYIKARLKERTA